MSPARAAPNGALQILRAGTYFLALRIVSTGALLAFVASTLPAPTRITLAAFGSVIAAVLVLLAHQGIGRMAVSATILLVLAFVAPTALVDETFDSTGCVQGVPCDPAPDLHMSLRFWLAAILLFAALVTAAAGWVRSSRSASATSPAH